MPTGGLAQSETYDLLVVTDATASMGGYLDALRSSIPEILALAKLSGAFSRLGVLAYKDYTDLPEEIIAWSGWNPSNLSDFVTALEPSGGQNGSNPGSASYAPPHHISVKSHGNDVAEANAFPAGAVDWVKLCHTARRRNCTVFTFTPNSMDVAHSAFYVLLAQLTGGISIASKAGSKSSALISRLTLGVILQWMGHGTSVIDMVLQDSAAILPSHEGLGSAGYLPPSRQSESAALVPLMPIISAPLKSSQIPTGTLTTRSFNLARRFADSSEIGYRDLVYESLTDIIQSNVACLTYNPIFRLLWRAVCKDTGNRKTGLVDLFSAYVGKVTDREKKAALRQWLDESFDQTEEIEGIVARHCAERSGPMVYLDFDADVHLTRTELLEVSRSCYAGVLKRIASVFTHLKLVEPGVALAPLQRSIPLTLPPREFFRILPHLIVPGTLYPARAATLTAVVAMITAVPFLKDMATDLLSAAKGKWLDTDIPENISFDCAWFLLSAPQGVVLTKQERKIYEAMRRYKLIEVPWTASKTRGPGDVKVQCKKCLVRRSITIMSHERDVCGFCFTSELSPSRVAARYPGVDETKNCRAQYVLEDVPALKIRPRRYYCRKGVPCPWLECSVCSNRIIVPTAYRTAKDRKSYTCPACNNPQWKGNSVVAVEATARTLIAQNGVEWLGFTNKTIFDNKSAFKLVQAFGYSVFSDAPSNKRKAPPNYVISQVEDRVGRGEVVLSTCALCFEEMPHSKLVSACGRTGCTQLVDKDCLREWYGQNKPGNLLNMIQFTCPFCRGSLWLASSDSRPSLFYAWCIDCGFAKRVYERTACREERIPLVVEFRCRECREAAPVASPESHWSATWVNVAGIRQCPNSDGCNHMICVCGTHFYFACGKEFPQLEINDHMYRTHGSVFSD
ncbi:hypothetical protein B0H11DRAFT_2168265 [Mycena galericulata]|nr:hypothetical protein B0H11DRAFT_2168265 [Mycena galericulata]